MEWLSAWAKRDPYWAWATVLAVVIALVTLGVVLSDGGDDSRGSAGVPAELQGADWCPAWKRLPKSDQVAAVEAASELDAGGATQSRETLEGIAGSVSDVCSSSYADSLPAGSFEKTVRLEIRGADGF